MDVQQRLQCAFTLAFAAYLVHLYPDLFAHEFNPDFFGEHVFESKMYCFYESKIIILKFCL